MDTNRFAAVIPLRAKATTTDWAAISQYCVQLINGVISAAPTAHAVLVCSDLPIGLSTHPRLIVAQADFGLPQSSHDQMVDKFKKVGHGARHLAPLCPLWLMTADADDLISSRLIRFLVERPELRYCLVTSGWVWPQGKNYVVRQNGFHLQCGTFFAGVASVADLPYEDDAGKWILNGHGVVADDLRASGETVFDLPFPGALYRVGHGQNHSGMGWLDGQSTRRALRRLWNTRPLSDRLRREFGLDCGEVDP